jgi:1-hydroxycarotenoid 3,4-desaturase
MRYQRVIVVGGGIGGLTSAALLAKAGVATTLIERAPAVGGKLREVTINGRGIDTGPTVLTMRWLLDDIFAALGTTIDANLSLQPMDILARHAWTKDEGTSGATLDLFADEARSADAIAKFAGPAAGRGYRAFCADARRTYATLEAPFIKSQRPNLPQLIGRISQRGLSGMADLWKLEPYATLWTELGKYFQDPRLRQLFGRYATYCGGSPYMTPATLMLVAHVEQRGVWVIDGGMRRLVDCLATLATQAGADIRTGRHVDEIVVRNGRVGGVRMKDGETLEADAVVFNGDVAALTTGLLGAGAAPSVGRAAAGTRSLSALTLSLVAPASGLPLVRHNVFFSDDYAAEFQDTFKLGRLPRSPTVYVCAQDRLDGATSDGATSDEATPAAGTPERLFCLVNAPPNGDSNRISQEDISRCRSSIFETLRRCGLDVGSPSPDSTMEISTPSDFHHRFPATGGALYGPAPHGTMAAFNRAGTRTKLPGLYLAGGSIHPGPGVPMAMLSGQLAARCLTADLASTRTSRLAVMRGGTSTA